MNARLAIVLAILMLAGPRPAAASPSPDVPCRQGGTPSFAAFAALPGPASLQLLRRFAPGTPDPRLAGMANGLIGGRDAPWQATDVVAPGARLPVRRFILGDMAKGRLRVWYESGGIAHMYHVAVLDPVGAYGWRIARHMAAGSLPALCQRLNSAETSLYDQYW